LKFGRQGGGVATMCKLMFQYFDIRFGSGFFFLEERSTSQAHTPYFFCHKASTQRLASILVYGSDILAIVVEMPLRTPRTDVPFIGIGFFIYRSFLGAILFVLVANQLHKSFAATFSPDFSVRGITIFEFQLSVFSSEGKP
jgi:hypothetical protein